MIYRWRGRSQPVIVGRWIYELRIRGAIHIVASVGSGPAPEYVVPDIVKAGRSIHFEFSVDAGVVVDSIRKLSTVSENAVFHFLAPEHIMVNQGVA